MTKRQRTYTCSLTNTTYVLPDGLSADNKGRANRWRYRKPKGERQHCLSQWTAADKKIFKPEEAIAIANELNARHGIAVPSSSKEETILQMALSEYKETEYIKFFESGKHGSSTYRNNCSSLNKFVREINHVPAHAIDTNLISDWWKGINDFRAEEFQKTPPNQKAMRRILTMFTSFLMRKKITRIDANIFNVRSDNCIPLGDISSPRADLQYDQFQKIQELAIANGEEWFAKAMDIAFATGMRRSDLVTLTFDDHIDEQGRLKKVFKKNLSRKVTARFWERGISQDLDDAIDYFISTRDKCIRKTKYAAEDRPAIYVIHDPNARMVAAEGKIHTAQVMPDKLTRAFQFYARQLEDIEALAGRERPVLHKIRGMFAEIQTEDGSGLSDTSDSMGHANISTTNGYLHGKKITYKEATPITHETMKKHIDRIEAEKRGELPPSKNRIEEIFKKRNPPYLQLVK